VSFVCVCVCVCVCVRARARVRVRVLQLVTQYGNTKMRTPPAGLRTGLGGSRRWRLIHIMKATI